MKVVSVSLAKCCSLGRCQDGHRRFCSLGQTFGGFVNASYDAGPSAFNKPARGCVEMWVRASIPVLGMRCYLAVCPRTVLRLCVQCTRRVAEVEAASQSDQPTAGVHRESSLSVRHVLVGLVRFWSSRCSATPTLLFTAAEARLFYMFVLPSVLSFTAVVIMVSVPLDLVPADRGGRSGRPQAPRGLGHHARRDRLLPHHCGGDGHPGLV